MLCYVVWHIGTNVSEDPAASVFRLEEGDSRFSQYVGTWVHTACVTSQKNHNINHSLLWQPQFLWSYGFLTIGIFLTYLITVSCLRVSFMWSWVSVGYKACNCVVCWHRNSEKSQRSQLDLCVVVFRTRSPASPEVGRLVEHSKRQVRGFVGCHKMLERDLYILVCLAFNHWHTGKLHLQTHNSSVLCCPTVDLTYNTQIHYGTYLYL